MVSSLSSRLLRGSQYIREEKQQSQQSHGENSIDQATNSSGYSTDREGASVGSPPVHIDIHAKRRRKLSSKEQEAKRRKKNEDNFAVANAAGDLTRAGQPYPQIMATRSRVIPGLDLSGVQLVSSKSSHSSPFLHKTAAAWSSSQYDLLTDFGAVYQDLLTQSAPAYQLPSPPPQPMPIHHVHKNGRTTEMMLPPYPLSVVRKALPLILFILPISRNTSTDREQGIAKVLTNRCYQCKSLDKLY